MASKLRIVDRIKGRQAARAAWIKSKQSGDDAKKFFEDDRNLVGLDPATILMLLKIALELWKWWQEKGIEEPSVVASPDEPGFMADEANDAD
jgi:hypothetical protein